MKTKFLLVLFLIVSLGMSAQESDLNALMQERNEYYFTFNLNGEDDLSAIAQTISVDRVDGNVVTAYANNMQFAKFQKMGYEVTLQTPPSMMVEAVMWDGNSRAEYDWDTYPTYEGYVSIMNEFATDHPDMCEIIDLGTLASGRKILVAHINNGETDGKPKFFYSSTIHGDETTGWMLMLRLIDYILENPTATECQNVLDNIDLYIAPLTNPDGTYHGGNSTVNGATRYNAYGVDMNRNYPDPNGGPHPDGEEYQLETQWLMQFAYDIPFVMGANYHGGAEVVNYPWDNTYTLHPDDAWFILTGREYADLTHEVSSSYMIDLNNGITNGAQWYMIGGGRQDFMNGYAECREVTVECSGTKLPPANQMPTFWNYNKESIFAFMNQCLYGIHGVVTDAESGLPIEATITIVGHDNEYSTVSSHLPAGDYHRPIKGGTYNVRITANGYEAYETQVTVADNETVTLNAQLTALEGLVADFTANVTSIAIGGTVNFSDASWGAQINSWSWEFEGGTPATSTEQNPSVVYAEEGTYDVRLTVTNAAGETDEKYVTNYISVVEAYNMQNGTINTCDAMFYDNGGPDANYSDNQNLTMTFMPDTEGGIIEVEFQSFTTESGYDKLYIYDGATTSSSQIGEYSGGSSPGTVTATNADGALTFVFTSDGSVNQIGWVAYVSCQGLPLEVVAEAENDTIDLTETNSLMANVTGGTGTYTYSWSPADNLDDATAQNPVFTPTEAGDFTYTVTVSDGNETATASVTFTVMDYTAVNEINSRMIALYPNPASSVVRIDGLKGYKNLEVMLVSMQGQIVKRSYNSLVVDVKDIDSGVYFVIIDCDGQQVMKRIVVE